MIRVTIFLNDNKECAGFRALGHAGFSNEGQDIVCASASVLMINTINAVETFTSDQTSLVSDDTEGFIEFQFKKNPSDDAALLLKAMILGLEEMAEDENYAEYIQVTFEEV